VRLYSAGQAQTYQVAKPVVVESADEPQAASFLATVAAEMVELVSWRGAAKPQAATIPQAAD
jgi:hypothetical protein